MLIRKALLAALLSATCAAHAADSINVGATTCTGALNTSFSSGVSLTCGGDLSLYTGTIESSTQILLSATGSLSLFDVTLNAPQVTLNAAQTNIQPPVSQTTTLNGFNVGVAIGNLGDSTHFVQEAVPEPSTFALVALGLFGAVYMSRRGRAS